MQVLLTTECYIALDGSGVVGISFGVGSIFSLVMTVGSAYFVYDQIMKAIGPQEISFQEFQNTLLRNGEVAKLEVVNRM